MKQISLDQFLNFKFLAKFHSIPSKDKIAYVVSSANYEKNEYFHELYETDGLKSKKRFSLGKSSAYVYEKQDTILVPFEKTKQDKKLKKENHTIYYRVNLVDKQKELAYVFPFSVEIVEVINDDLLLLKSYSTNEELSLKDLADEKRKKALDVLKKGSNYIDIEEIPFYFNGAGFTAGKYNQLFIYKIKDKKLLPLHTNKFNSRQAKVNKDKNEIIFTATKRTKMLSLTNQVYSYNYVDEKLEVIYDKDDYSFNAFYLLGDLVIYYASDMQKYGLNQNGSFYTITDNKIKLLSNFPTSLGNSIGSDARFGGSKTAIKIDNKLYFTTTVDDHSEIYCLDKNAKLEQVFILDGSIDGLCSINKKVYGVLLYKQRLQEVYELDLESKRVKKLTSHNQKALKDYYVAKPQEVVLKKDGFEVKGFVLLPKDYQKTQKYPAILDIHGGPKTVYGKVYYHEMQYWANKGYFVFFANPRGSDGKGDEFSDIRGKYGTIDYEDLMDFTDKVLIKYPAIDIDKLYVTGGSYGGFMTNFIVGQTNRFRAAATQRSISNWISFYSTADIGFYFAYDQTGGHPLLDINKLWQQSPLKYALNIKTPLLIIHSDQDYRCPIEQAMQIYGILKTNNIDTKLVWFKGENHDLSRSGKPQARVKRLSEITEWFVKH